MQIGAHVSSSGGLPNAVDRAVAIGAEAVQIFASAPQQWAFRMPSDKLIDDYRERFAAAGLGSTWLHGVYLTNLGTEDSEKLDKGVQSLIDYMTVGSRIGASGVIFHTGSHKGAGLEMVALRVVESLKRVLASSPADMFLCLENSAGAGNSIGKNFSELGALIQAVDDPRLRVCLDTCHLFAAGYDVTTREALDRLFEEFDRECGAERLVVFHANDSKKGIGSKLDRHENIGEGCIGLDGFRAILTHPRTQDLPFLLEVPGYDDNGPDTRNVATMKALAGRS